MLLAQNASVYLEAVKESENKGKKFDKDGNSGILCTNGDKLSERSLVQCKPDNSKTSHDKRKTDK